MASDVLIQLREPVSGRPSDASSVSYIFDDEMSNCEKIALVASKIVLGVGVAAAIGVGKGAVVAAAFDYGFNRAFHFTLSELLSVNLNLITVPIWAGLEAISGGARIISGSNSGTWDSRVSCLRFLSKLY